MADGSRWLGGVVWWLKLLVRAYVLVQYKDRGITSHVRSCSIGTAMWKTASSEGRDPSDRETKVCEGVWLGLGSFFWLGWPCGVSKPDCVFPPPSLTSRAGS